MGCAELERSLGRLDEQCAKATPSQKDHVPCLANFPATVSSSRSRTPSIRNQYAHSLHPLNIAGIGVPVPPLGAGPFVLDTAEQHKIRVTIVTKGLVHPWSLAFLPDGDKVVTERLRACSIRARSCFVIVDNPRCSPTMPLRPWAP